MEKQPSFGEVEHNSLDQLSTSEQTDLVELSNEELEGVTGGGDSNFNIKQISNPSPTPPIDKKNLWKKDRNPQYRGLYNPNYRGIH